MVDGIVLWYRLLSLTLPPFSVSLLFTFWWDLGLSLPMQDTAGSQILGARIPLACEVEVKSSQPTPQLRAIGIPAVVPCCIRDSWRPFRDLALKIPGTKTERKSGTKAWRSYLLYFCFFRSKGLGNVVPDACPWLWSYLTDLSKLARSRSANADLNRPTVYLDVCILDPKVGSCGPDAPGWKGRRWEATSCRRPRLRALYDTVNTPCRFLYELYS
jgi:hypothetical protein